MPKRPKTNQTPKNPNNKPTQSSNNTSKPDRDLVSRTNKNYGVDKESKSQ